MNRQKRKTALAGGGFKTQNMHDSLVRQRIGQVRGFMLIVNSDTSVLIQHACKTTLQRTDMMPDTVFHGVIKSSYIRAIKSIKDYLVWADLRKVIRERKYVG